MRCKPVTDLPDSSLYRVRVAQDSSQQTPPVAAPARALLPTVVPALVVGVVTSLLLVGVSTAAEELQDVYSGLEARVEERTELLRRAQSELGFRAEVSLEDGLARTWDSIQGEGEERAGAK